MYQYVAHTFYNIPLYLWMSITELYSQFIDCFANNLDMLYKAKKQDGIAHYIINSIFLLVFQQNIYCLQNML